MSSIVLAKSDAYINIGCAKAWREYLLQHTFSAWIKTPCQSPACLISLSNEQREVFSVDICISSHPPRDATGIAVKHSHSAPGKFLQSAGSRVLRAPSAKSLRPVKAAGIHGAILGDLAGGIRVTIVDDDGNQLIAETPVPILADNAWHFLQVNVDKQTVAVIVDSHPVSVFYPKRDTLGEIDWRNVGERVVFPSHDLIAARYSKDFGVRDHFCGLLGDIAVEIGPPGGHKLHWWVTEASKGTIIWDHGNGARQHPQGLHLNLCSCGWDTEDFPATSLLLNGYEGKRAEVPELTETVLERLAKTTKTDNPSEPTPALASADEIPATPPLPPSGWTTPKQGPGPCTVSPGSESFNSGCVLPEPVTPSFGSSGNKGHRGEDDEPVAPVSQTMNREYFERVEREEGRQSMSFALWVCSRDRDPAIVFTVPFRNPVHMILNLDCKASVSLVNGLDAFVSQCDVTDGKWHFLRWLIDPNTGASLFVDGILSAWQYVPLQVDEESGALRRADSSSASKSFAQLKKIRSTASNNFSSKKSSRDLLGMGSKISSKRSSIVDIASNQDFQTELRKRSVVTSLIQRDDRKASNAQEPKKEGGRQNRARRSIAFIDGGEDFRDSIKREASMATLQRSRPAPAAEASASSFFAADEDDLFGDILDALDDEADALQEAAGEESSTSPFRLIDELSPLAIARDLMADVSSEESDCMVPSPAPSRQESRRHSPTAAVDVPSSIVAVTAAQQFLMLSIRKRREIISILTGMLQRKTTSGTDETGSTPPCLTVGQYFSGEIRDFAIRIGDFHFHWQFDAGTGRSIKPKVRSSRGIAAVEMASSISRGEGIFTPNNEGLSVIQQGLDAFGCEAAELDSENDLVRNISAEMNLTGLTTVFPKTILPFSVANVDDETMLDLGGIRLPIERRSTGFDCDFFVKLRGQHFGQVLLVECVVTVELRKDRFIVTVPSLVDDDLLNKIIQSAPQGFDRSVLDSTRETTRLIAISSDTTLFQDACWHHVKLSIPTVSDYRGIRVLIDEIPLELTPAFVWEQLPSTFSRGSVAFSGARRGTMLAVQQRHSVSKPAGGNQPTTPTPTSKDTSRSRHFDVGYKVRSLLQPLSGPVLPAAPHAASDVQLACVVGGGCGFAGSVVQLAITVNGHEYHWPLSDACRRKLARYPPFVESRFLTHAKCKTPHSTVPSTPSVIQSLSADDEKNHWHHTKLPSKALHFDGYSSFVSAVNLRANFHMSNLQRFSVSLWVKSGSPSDQGVGLQSGCLFSIHDLKKPITEASCGIFTHTRVDEFSSPRKRLLEPYVTSFLLVDSCARALALQIDCDIYDGLWHKLQWVVYDSALNESHVFVDDIAVPCKVVCGDHPREYSCRSPTLNVGARNEGENDVTNLFVGEIRNFRLSRDVNDDILHWPMTEGEGFLLHDELHRVSGCVWAPDWIYTPFPPMTPVLSEDTIIEFSPVHDMEAFSSTQPIWVTFSIKSNSSEKGIVWSIVSADRSSLASFTANEGGDHDRRVAEQGTHTLRIQRIVKKGIISQAPVGAASFGTRSPLSSLLSPDHASSLDRRDYYPHEVDLAELHTVETLGASVNHQADCNNASLRSSKKRRVVRRHELLQLLKEQERDAVLETPTVTDELLSTSKRQSPSNTHTGSNRSPARPSFRADRMPTRQVTVLEERVYQFHLTSLCDGRWHSVTIEIPPNPLATDAKVLVDELDMHVAHVSTHDIRELPENIAEIFAALPPTNANNVRERNPMEVLRDQVSWASMVLGKASGESDPALHCCIRNFGVLVHSKREELLFVPFASNMDKTSSIPRDVAATGCKWELSVPPKSCITLGGGRYVIIPPLRMLKLRSFEISFMLRSTATIPSCIFEFGSVTKGYFCITLNQDAFGERTPNSLRFCLSDADGKEMHASCFLSDEDALADNVEDDHANKERPQRHLLEDDAWHSVTVRIVDTCMNSVVFEIDGKYPQVRYANCGSPGIFHDVTEGGTIGALLDVLEPKMTLFGSIKNVRIANLLLRDDAPLVTIVDAAQESQMSRKYSRRSSVMLTNGAWVDRELVALYELTSGFASILTDRSGHRNHAMAVNPVWRTDLQGQWPRLEIASKATDIFSTCHLCVSRWSNNPSDDIERNPRTNEIVMDDFPDEGWISGAKGPQWISIDLGMAHTVFGIEFDLFRGGSSKHEVYVSVSNMSKFSSSASFEENFGHPVPQATCIASFHVRPASPRTTKVPLCQPLWGIRYIRIVTTESSAPAGYSKIRVIATRGDWNASRKYSVSEAIGRALQVASSQIDSGPMLSMFPDAFIPGKMEKMKSLSPKHSHRSTIVWGGEDEQEETFLSGSLTGMHSTTSINHPQNSSQFGRRVLSRGRLSTIFNASAASVEEELAVQQQLRDELLRTLRKTAAQREREMKLIFYTQDVERSGTISLVDFLKIFRESDITGLVSEEQVLYFLRDAGVEGSLVDFEQFMKVFSRLESW